MAKCSCEFKEHKTARGNLRGAFISEDCCQMSQYCLLCSTARAQQCKDSMRRTLQRCKDVEQSQIWAVRGIRSFATDEDISFAADLAAFYSKAREEGKVQVVKTRVANLKKIPGAAPGKVSADSLLVIVWQLHGAKYLAVGLVVYPSLLSLSPATHPSKRYYVSDLAICMCHLV